MEIIDQLEKMKNLHSKMLEFIDCAENIEEHFENLMNLIEEQKIRECLPDLKLFLHLLVCISNDHHREANFFMKIERILKNLKKEIQNFTNSELFKIFKSNKRVLLFLISEKMIIFDKSIINKFNKFKYKLLRYPQYFSPEIQSFKAIENEEIPIDSTDKTEEEKNDFNRKRLEGENDDFICKIIRNDSIEEFITFVKKENYFLKSNIKQSIYETNSFLMNRNSTLIQYAAFFGSVQIFKYLFINKVEITESVWNYAVHSDNPEMIYLLEENTGNKNDLSYKEFFLEAIKCNNNDVANYIQDKYWKEKSKKIGFRDFEYNLDEIISSYSFRYCNFDFITENISNNNFLNACKYDYLSLVKLYLASEDKYIKQINLNALYAAAKKDNQEIIKLLLACNSYKIIDSNFFENCTKLTRISLPTSITSIGNYAFSGCSFLEEIVIPTTVTAIGEYAFNGCSSLIQVIIPSSITKIENGVFKKCISLQNITLPSSVSSIGVDAFNECSSLSQMSLPTAISVIEGRSFFKCSSLEKISLPSSVISIESFTFCECSSLKEISFPSSLVNIRYGSFKNCKSLKQIKIPSSVVLIEKYAFCNCSLLSAVSFDTPSSLTIIDDFAFNQCVSLNQILIPKSVNHIGKQCFSSNTIILN